MSRPASIRPPESTSTTGPENSELMSVSRKDDDGAVDKNDETRSTMNVSHRSLPGQAQERNLRAPSHQLDWWPRFCLG